MSGATTIGVVGLGYWGPNLARNFDALADAELRWCCDADEAIRARASGEASQHHASSQPGIAAKLRARFGPQ